MNNRWWMIAFVICLGLAAVAPLASASPDGLERVAEDGGFLARTWSARYEVMADYVFPGIENPVLAVIAAGWLGTSLLFGVTYLMAFILYTRRKKETAG